MALKKSEKRLLGLLGVVALVFLLDRFVLSGGDDEPAPSNTTASRVRAASALLTGGAGKTGQGAQTKVRFDSWGRDPFTTLASARRATASSEAAATSAKQHELRGLFWKEGKAFALIDDMVIGEGEENGGVRVERIEGTEVLCRRGSRSFTLHWSDSP